MKNKEQIQKNISLTFDFIEQIIDNPELLEKIPEGSVVTFVNEPNVLIEKQSTRIPNKKYVRVKRHFEIL